MPRRPELVEYEYEDGSKQTLPTLAIVGCLGIHRSYGLEDSWEVVHLPSRLKIPSRQLCTSKEAADWAIGFWESLPVTYQRKLEKITCRNDLTDAQAIQLRRMQREYDAKATK